MTLREASCTCGRLRAVCVGDPVRVSVCHCLNCQRRSGSVFAVQARWPDDLVTLTGDAHEFALQGDSGGTATFRFCPECGATISYVCDAMEGVTAIPVGAFADPRFPPPAYSVYESRKHGWVTITGDDIDRFP